MTQSNRTETEIDVPQRLQAAKLGMLIPRTISHLIDLAILIGIALAFRWATGLGYERSDGLFLLGCGMALSYFLIGEWRWGGTIGKKVLGLVVVDRQGCSISFGEALIRSLLRVVEASIGPLCLVGGAFILLSKDSQRLGDWMAGTYVVPKSLITRGGMQR
ncbi:MAG: RDD family protein [Pseudomonadota bacterium]